MASKNRGIIQKAQQAETAHLSPQGRMQKFITDMNPQIAAALPSVLTPERFTRMMLTALSRTPDLAVCTPQSFGGAMMQAAQLGLEPNTPLGQAYLIPYRNHGVMEVQFQIGYKGLIDLTYRSGKISTIYAHEVYSGDKFEYELGLDCKLVHVPAMKNRGEVIGYYAVYKTKDGGSGFYFMSRDDATRYCQQYSKAASKGFSPWTTNFDAMAKKTTIKQLLKYAPLGTEFVRAITADETIKNVIQKDMVEAPDETVFDVEAEEVPGGYDTDTTAENAAAEPEREGAIFEQ